MKRSYIFWGVILIFAAILLLLNNLGVISNFFGYFWILILMFVGVWLIISALSRPHKEEGEKISVPIGGELSARIKIDHGAGHLNIHSGVAPGNILDGVCVPAPVIKTVSNEERMDVKINFPSEIWAWMPGDSRDWDLSLAKDLPILLEIDSGASTAIVNLVDLHITELDLDTGASTVDITLPANAGHTLVKVDSGVATVKVHIPKGVAAQIRTESGLASISIDKRYPKTGHNSYASPDYNNAANRADIIIKTGVASVEID